MFRFGDGNLPEALITNMKSREHMVDWSATVPVAQFARRAHCQRGRLGSSHRRQLRRNCWLVAGLILVWSTTAPGQNAGNVKTITIHSSWTGLGPRGEATLQITKHGTKFQAGGKSIDDKSVENLLQEIGTSRSEPTLEDFAITQSWLESNSQGALPERLRNAPPDAKNLFLSRFRDLGFIEKLLPEILEQGWTDDYPAIDVQILRDDGATTRLSSERQNVFMLPITIDDQKGSHLSYNAKMSRAIAALLPPGFINRDRLNGTELKSVVTERVISSISEGLDLLETRNKIGAELKQLEGRYTLARTAINHVSSVDVETLGEKFPRWNAMLQRSDLPQNIMIGVSLPYDHDRLVTFESFLKNIDSFVALSLSVPWLEKYLREHRDVRMEIRFVTDRSASPKLVSYFLETAKALGAEPLAAKVTPVLDKSAFVEFQDRSGWSRWLVLPDRRMILFDFQGDAVLGWKLTDFNTRSRYNSNFWHMASAVVSADGTIESR